MNQVEKSIQELTKTLQDKTVFIAVSAGIDSTLLLELASKYFTIIALHVNYKLRGVESDEDQKFLEEFCKERNIRLQTKVYDLGYELKQKPTNLQNRARQIRYDFFQDYLKKHKNAVLFIGHHADDQVETFFLHYFRNSGLAGLSGMKKRQDQIIRPFLDFSKQELIQCAEELKLTWREDQSNAKNEYLRNRFRNEIIPFVEKEIPEIKTSVLNLMNVLRENQGQIEQEISVVLGALQKTNNILIHELKSWRDDRFIEFLRQMEIPTGFLTEFKKLLYSQKGSRLDLTSRSKYQKIIRERDSLYFVKKETEIVNLPKLKSRVVHALPTSYSKNKLYLDNSKIEGVLHVRKWKVGDRIYPIGLNGSKLISDVLTDAKVPHNERANQWVICDESKIISCGRFCIDRRAIASSESSIILCLEIIHSKAIQ